MVYAYTDTPKTTYTAIPVWVAQSSYVLFPNSALNEKTIFSPVDYSRNAQKHVYYQSDSAYGCPKYVPAPSIPAPSFSFPPIPNYSFNDRVVCVAQAFPANPEVDKYPIFYPIPPHGPSVCYTHPLGATQAQPPREQGCLICAPSPLPIYSPSVEMQYVPTPTCVYLSTPPVASHNSPHVNSQGFMFPSSLNNNCNCVRK